jgi:hypothetical protein
MIRILAIGIFAVVGNAPAQSADCRLLKHNQGTIVDGALVYSTPILKVDADGAPSAYRLDGQGLSFTCDGVAAIENGRKIGTDDPQWQKKCRSAWNAARESGDYSKIEIFGFATDAMGAPLIQRDADALASTAFISTTFVNVLDAPEGTQRRYIDSLKIPYVVIPERIRQMYSVQDAAVAAVWRPHTQTLTFAVFGDTGGKFDEASIRLHQDLHNSPLVKQFGAIRARRNIEDSVVVALFPARSTHARLDAAAWRSEIVREGSAALEQWGGPERLKKCGP